MRMGASFREPDFAGASGEGAVWLKFQIARDPGAIRTEHMHDITTNQPSDPISAYGFFCECFHVAQVF